MKTSIIRNLFLFPALIAGLGLMMLAGRVTAQTFTTLHSFTASSGPYPYPGTNSDGAFPNGGLITNLLGNTLYGTAQYGGSSGVGTVFKVNTDGTGFTNLHTFTAIDLNTNTNSDGARPLAGLILSGNTLYGTASSGSLGYGTVFAINTDGTDFTNVYSFTGDSGGAFPNGLVLSGNTLYGTTIEEELDLQGGLVGNIVFRVNTDGTGFTTLYDFTGADQVPRPSGELILSGNTLYGTADSGGGSGNGTVFSLSFRPQLTITLSGGYAALTWPTNVAGFDYTGFTLQFTTSLVSPAVWTTVFPGPVDIDGQNTVINPISAAQQFYRLRQRPVPPYCWVNADCGCPEYDCVGGICSHYVTGHGCNNDP